MFSFKFGLAFVLISLELLVSQLAIIRFLLVAGFRLVLLALTFRFRRWLLDSLASRDSATELRLLARLKLLLGTLAEGFLDRRQLLLALGAQLSLAGLLGLASGVELLLLLRFARGAAVVQFAQALEYGRLFLLVRAGGERRISVLLFTALAMRSAVSVFPTFLANVRGQSDGWIGLLHAG